MAENIALVTGASAGIGWELASELASRGYDLWLVARREDRLRQLATKISAENGRRAETLALDLTNAQDREKLRSKMERSAEALNLVINNAGFGIVGPTVRASLERIMEMIELNITALTELSHSAANLMIRKRAGGIINVASTAAFQAVPYMSVYSATKAYVLSFSEALAEELSAHGVRVMALCPGYTRTEFQTVAGARENDSRLRRAMSAAECARIGLDDYARWRNWPERR